MIEELINKIKRKWKKIRLQPIRVFCFHHVSAVRDQLVCQEEDWTEMDQFKRNIEKLQEVYMFISLSEACEMLRNDNFRFRHYAVLTTDDGLASVLNVTQWLEDKGVPLTLFINTRYMAGDILKPVHQKWLHELEQDADEKEIAKRMYLSKEQIWALQSSYIEIGLHGHEHLDARYISEKKFEEDTTLCMRLLEKHPRFIPIYAYPWGNTTVKSLEYLELHNIVPVLITG